MRPAVADAVAGSEGSRRLPWRQTWAPKAFVSIGLLLCLASMSARLVEFATTPAVATGDYSADYVAAHAARGAGAPYDELETLFEEHLPGEPYPVNLPPEQRNPHSPALIASQIPLSFLSLRTARIVWMALSASAFVVGMVVALRGMGFSGWSSVALGTALVATPLVQKDLMLGQSNGVSLLLLATGWLAWRRGLDRRAGIALGVLSALRVFPALLLIPVVMARRWTIARAMVATALGVGLIGALAVGFGDVLDGLGDAWSETAAYWSDRSGNISLTQRLPVALQAIGIGLHPPEAAVVMIGVVAATVAAAGRGPDGLWIFTGIMLLALPVVWEHYLILILPMTVVAFCVTRFLLPSVLGATLVWISIPPASGVISQWEATGFFVPTVGAALLMAGMWRNRGALTDGRGVV